MKNSTIHGPSNLRSFALLMTFSLFCGATLPAAEAPAAAPPHRLISLVMLLSEPRVLDSAAVAHAVSNAMRTEVPESAISPGPPSFVVKTTSGRFAINSVNQPYFADSGKLAAELKDTSLSNAIRQHQAWLSVDWLEKDDQADLRKVYQHISQIIVHLMRKDTLAVYSPDTDQFHLNDETLLGHLNSPDPLQALMPTGVKTAGITITISDDDPQLIQAQAEAKKHWPEFIQAFKTRVKTQYFAVKGRILEGDSGEYVWLQITDIDDTLVHGKLDNDPETLKKVKRGADLHIPIADVDDWLYSTGTGNEATNHGGFTLRLFDQLAEARLKN